MIKSGLRVRIPARGAGEFSSSHRVTAVARKRPRVMLPKVQLTRIHLNTHTPLTKQGRSGLIMLFGNRAGTYQGNELKRNSSGNAQPQSCQLAETVD